MTQTVTKPKYDFSDRTKYDALMEVVRYRVTTRAFDASYVMPHEHYEMILDAARHAPSGANTQPWHFIVITDQNLKNRIMEYFREEQVHRAKLKMKFPTPDLPRPWNRTWVYRGGQRLPLGEGFSSSQ